MTVRSQAFYSRLRQTAIVRLYKWSGYAFWCIEIMRQSDHIHFAWKSFI